MHCGHPHNHNTSYRMADHFLAQEGLSLHRGRTQSVGVADCYFIVNVLDLPFASPIAIYR